MWSEQVSGLHRTRQKKSSPPAALHDKISFPYVIILMRTRARVHQKSLFVRRKNSIKKGPAGPLITINVD
ncbi:hypothetical protein AM349_08600 [Citrobacter freundii]|nr:hypothetical protein AM349_08600 [Citrobacter freundii]AUU29109.1 hypothetical protein MC62_012955 [Citrobacter freundii]AYL45234.1 hypothetical protein CUC45_12320 [Citrobacter freundii]MBE0050598.1 hypothetical protein [Citrobacter freundii]NFV64151.1 hypothetical protein [Citrobacter freundii]